MADEAPSFEELTSKIAILEGALHRCERLEIASRFASALMHEVNNPLEAIGNLVYLAKSDRTNPDLVLQYLNMVEAQLSVLSNITRQTLSFHRNQLQAKDEDLVGVAEAAIKLYASRIEKGSITVNKRLPATAIATCISGEILQVMSNLILNALDVLPSTDAFLSVRVYAGKKMLTITVADNGPGIPERVLSTLFEPFNTSKNTGTGLGLWLSKRIIEKHKGSIRYRTCRRPGRNGTVYRVSLPIS